MVRTFVFLTCTVVLNIVKGEKPVIEGYTPGFRLLVSDPPLHLSCKVPNVSGKPSWNCPGHHVVENETETEKFHISKIVLKVGPELKDKTCWCTNADGEENDHVTFVVLDEGSKCIWSSLETHSGSISVGFGIAYFVFTSVIIILLCNKNKKVQIRFPQISKKFCDERDTREMERHISSIAGYDVLGLAQPQASQNPYMSSPVV